MSTVTMTQDTFEDTVKQHGIVVIDFWAQWCGPCRAFAPTFEAAAKAHPDLVFAKVNTEQEPELSAMFGVRSIPMLVVFRDTIPVFGQPGALGAQSLEELIAKVRALDMDQVRQDYEHQVPQAPGDDPQDD